MLGIDIISSERARQEHVTVPIAQVSRLTRASAVPGGSIMRAASGSGRLHARDQRPQPGEDGAPARGVRVQRGPQTREGHVKHFNVSSVINRLLRLHVLRRVQVDVGCWGADTSVSSLSRQQRSAPWTRCTLSFVRPGDMHAAGETLRTCARQPASARARRSDSAPSVRTVATYPVSSFSSRNAATAGDSPGSIKPAGSSSVRPAV